MATLDPFHGYKNAIDDRLEDAVSVLDAFHVVKLGTQVVDDVRCRVQQTIHGHRGRRDDPLYKIRSAAGCGWSGKKPGALQTARPPPAKLASAIFEWIEGWYNPVISPPDSGRVT